MAGLPGLETETFHVERGALSYPWLSLHCEGIRSLIQQEHSEVLLCATNHLGLRLKMNVTFGDSTVRSTGGMQTASKNWKRQWNVQPPERTEPCQHLDFSTVRSYWSSDLQNCKIVVCVFVCFLVLLRYN